MPHISIKKPIEYDEKKAKERSNISRKYGFIDLNYKLYHRIRTFDAENYATLIKTYSDHRAAGEECLELFTKKITETINIFGGTINIYDTIDLQLAKKP